MCTDSSGKFARQTVSDSVECRILGRTILNSPPPLQLPATKVNSDLCNGQSSIKLHLCRGQRKANPKVECQKSQTVYERVRSQTWMFVNEKLYPNRVQRVKLGLSSVLKPICKFL